MFSSNHVKIIPIELKKYLISLEDAPFPLPKYLMAIGKSLENSNYL